MEPPSTSGNTLNRSMSTMWMAHRRAKLNLNSPSSIASTVPTPLEEKTPIVDEVNPTLPNVTPALEFVEPELPPGSTDGTTTTTDMRSGKRKARTRAKTEDDRDGSTVGKRPRVGAIAKDYAPPTARLSDLGGVGNAVEKMLELVAMPLCHPEVYIHTGVHPPRGVLLHGPPGCGKTLLANAIAGELGVPFINISAPSIVSGMSGESEKTLRDTFDEAKRVAPCLLFIDEIDAVTPKRESAQREMERRIVAQFLTCMDDLSWEKTDNKPVIVIGATNRPDALDAALRRAGRFDHEVAMSVPDEVARAQILRVMSGKLRLEGDFDFVALARATPGYVGADLAALTGAAGIVAVKRIFKELTDTPPTATFGDGANSEDKNTDAMAIDSDAPPVSTPAHPPTTPTDSSLARFLATHPDPLSPAELAPLHVSYADFTAALRTVQPSALREGFATVPDVSWADVGALGAVRDELHLALVAPVRRPDAFARLGLNAPAGVLLWGPPGCGKTLLAKAVAHESGANFISVKGPELLNKYVGESERAVRQVFSRARASAPCVIFFDELDALVPRRDDNLSESSARVVNTLLTELDGLDSRRGVHVLGATNRPDMLDPALCRPGRLDKLLYVDLPNADERADIVRTLLRAVPVDGADDAKEGVAQLVRANAEGYSGADLSAFVREAGVLALRRALGGALDRNGPLAVAPGNQDADADVAVCRADFEAALSKVRPSVSAAQKRRYEALRDKFAGQPVRAGIKIRGEAEGDAGDADAVGEGVAGAKS